VAAAIEECARFHDETGRENFTGDDRFGLDFYFAFGADRAVEAAGDDDVVPFDFTFDAGVFAEDERFVRNKGAFGGAVDSECSGGFEAAFEPHPLFEEAGPFARILPFTVKPTKSNRRLSPGNLYGTRFSAKNYFRMSWS